jgi:Amt family ammonium transporter
MAALAGAIVLGPRIGKYTKDGKPVAMPGHHIPMALVGTLILAFGWFGFNPGSTLAGTDLRVSVVATNTMLAGTGGAITSMIYMMWRFGKPDPSMMANGMLAGLVAITAPCAFVTASVSMLIGAISGVLVCLAVFFVEGTLKVDDPSVPFPSTASMAPGACSRSPVRGRQIRRRLERRSRHRHRALLRRCPAVLRPVHRDADLRVFVFTSFYLFFKLVDVVIGNRVSAEVEIAGLDLPEMGALAYPEFEIATSTTSSGALPAPTPMPAPASAPAPAKG